MQTFIEWVFTGVLFILAMIIAMFAFPLLIPVALVLLVIFFVFAIMLVTLVAGLAVALIELVLKFAIPTGIIYLLYRLADYYNLLPGGIA